MATDTLRAFAKFALTSPPRSLIGDFGLAALFFLSAVLAEVIIGFSFANAPPYTTFFPLLVLTSLLCSLSASIAYIRGFCHRRFFLDCNAACPHRSDCCLLVRGVPHRRFDRRLERCLSADSGARRAAYGS